MPSPSASERPDAHLAAHTTHRSASRKLFVSTGLLIALIAGSTYWIQSPAAPAETASSGSSQR